MLLTFFLVVGKTNFLAHNYILCIHLDVMEKIGDDQQNIECNIREIKIRKFH